VVDRLCDRAKEQNIAVACFYVDFAAREGQTPTNMLGSPLKQIVGSLERIPDEIRQTFQDHQKVIGRRGLRMPVILKTLQVSHPYGRHLYVLMLWTSVRKAINLRC